MLKQQLAQLNGNEDTAAMLRAWQTRRVRENALVAALRHDDLFEVDIPMPQRPEIPVPPRIRERRVPHRASRASSGRHDAQGPTATESRSARQFHGSSSVIRLAG